MRTEKYARAIRIALAWYQRGLSSTTPLERFFSFLVGLEALVNANASEHGPAPESSERAITFEKVRNELAKVLSHNVMSRLAERFIEPSFGDRARFYTKTHGWGSEFYDEIRHLYNLRNQAVHGDPVIIGIDEVRRAQAICVKSLKSELGIADDLPWD
jgi:hypothetical protein